MIFPRNIRKILLSVSLMCACVSSMNADMSYATTSKLSQGNWVKIEVSDNGVYEITDAQLKEMGFAAPEKVKIFGRGGAVLPETFSSAFADDLTQIPTLRGDGKTVFYGCGPIAMTVNGRYTSTVYYKGDVNPYALSGCYFLTDSENYSALQPAVDETQPTGTNRIEKSYDYLYHNKDMVSLGTTGKLFWGEDLSARRQVSFDLNLPNVVSGAPVAVSVSVGGIVKDITQVAVSLGGDKVPYLTTAALIRPVTSEEYYYNSCSVVTNVNPTDNQEQRKLTVGIGDTEVTTVRLDYYSLTYQRRNVIPADSAQVRMGLNEGSANDVIVLPQAGEQTVVWNIDNTEFPVSKTLSYSVGEARFAPSCTGNWQQYVMFDTSKQLKSISGWQAVKNQDLHAQPVPNMVIVCRGEMAKQAERIAGLHREKENMDVLVVDEEQIFNEFSSGTPDATAYRLFLKMLYDRNPEKLQYLLLLGRCSYDNRSIGGKRSDYQLLSYQSAESRYESNSYTSDDYFAFLGDNSGLNLISDPMSIAVGRMPASTIPEAEKLIAKLERYLDDDYGVWHNNVLLMADQGNDFLHCYQAEGIGLLMAEKSSGLLMDNKVYVPYFALDGDESATARREAVRHLSDGQLFMSYVGHAGPTSLTGSYLWRQADAASVESKHPAIGFFAACNTARYDSDLRGIGETMFLNPVGGTIAIVVSARTAYSSQNDRLHTAFVKSALELKNNGEYKTVGEAFKDCINSYGTIANLNKMNFVLLGDPSIKIKFPQPQCRLTSVNGIAVDEQTDVKLFPLTQVTVKGVVTDGEGNIDTSFDGTVNLRLYDKLEPYDISKTSTNSLTSTREYSYSRVLLNEATAVVKNGAFEVDIEVPEECKAQGDSCLISVFATDGKSKMVAASYENATIEPFEDGQAVADDEAPAVSLTVGDGSGIIGTSAVVKVAVSDNRSINMTTSNPAAMMTMTLDDGKVAQSSLNRYFVISDNGRTALGELPLTDMAAGRHSIDFSVCDVAGNRSVAKAEFVVTGDETLSAELKTATTVVRETAEVELVGAPESCEKVTFTVTGMEGNTVRTVSQTGTAWQWNLKNDEGTRVVPGRYRIAATFETPTAWGRTNEQEIIVPMP